VLVTVRQTGGAWLWEARWDGQDHSGYVWEEDQLADDVRRAYTGDLRAPILAYTSSPALATPHVPTGAGAALATPVEAAVEVDTMNFVHEPEYATLEQSLLGERVTKFVESLRNSQGHYWTPVAKELAFGVIYGKPIPQEATSPLYCAHSNCAPNGACLCQRYCYCRVVGNCGAFPLDAPYKLPDGTAKEISRRVDERRK
jgi:hypothetical protein